MAAAITVGLRGVPAASSLLPLLPRLGAPVLLSSSRWATITARPVTIPLPFLPIALPIALPEISLNIPDILGDIWESVLRAVPKKKTSYSKTRSRQLAGKALEDVTNLCQCPGCGQQKRTHRVCPDCLAKIYKAWERQSRMGPDQQP